MRAVISNSEKRIDGQRKCNEEARARQLRNNISVAFCGLFLLAAFAAINIVLLQSVLNDPLGGERTHRFIGPLLKERLKQLAREGRNKLTGRHGDRPQTEQQMAWARAAVNNGTNVLGHMVKQLTEDIAKRREAVSPAAEKSSTSAGGLEAQKATANLRGRSSQSAKQAPVSAESSGQPSPAPEDADPVKIETLKHPPENGNGASVSPLSSTNSEAKDSGAQKSSETTPEKAHHPDPKVDLP